MANSSRGSDEVFECWRPPSPRIIPECRSVLYSLPDVLRQPSRRLGSHAGMPTLRPGGIRSSENVLQRANMRRIFAPRQSKWRGYCRSRWDFITRMQCATRQLVLVDGRAYACILAWHTGLAYRVTWLNVTKTQYGNVINCTIRHPPSVLCARFTNRIRSNFPDFGVQANGTD